MNSTSSNEVYYATDSDMWKFIAPILIPLGVTENLISVVILSRKKFALMPSRRTLIYLSVCDSLVLLVGLLRYWSVAMFQVHPNEVNSFACKSLSFLVFFTSHSSAALVGLISIERVIAVLTPAWLKVKTANIDKYGGPLTFLLIMLFDFHVPFTSDLFLNPVFNNTLPPASGLHHNICVSVSAQIAFVVDVVDTTLLFYLPFAVILTCNLAIISHIRMSTRRLSTAGSSQYSQTSCMTPAKQVPLVAEGIEGGNAGVPAAPTTAALTPAKSPAASQQRHLSIFKMSSLSRQSTRRRTSKRRDTRVTTTLLLVTSMFLVCNLPFSVIHVVNTALEDDSSVGWDYAWLIAYALVFVNNCLNFPIYIISQPLFRKEVMRICRVDKAAPDCPPNNNNSAATRRSCQGGAAAEKSVFV